MSENSLVPVDAPDSDPQQEPDRDPFRDNRRGNAKRRRTKGPLLTADDCRRMLGALPQLVLFGSITTQQANSIKGILSELLADTRKSATSGATPPPDKTVVDQLRSSPELLAYFEPLLSDEVFNKILGIDDETEQA
jgi:hypothetical protein